MTEQLQVYIVADHEKCVGCKACELACFAQHNHKTNRVGRTVGTVTVPVTPRLYLTQGGGFRMPVQCRHCEDAPCLSACTLGAISRVEGAIVISEARCTGCKDCLMACPFGAIELRQVWAGGAPVMLQESGEVKKAALKCDRCFEDPAGPACVRACASSALRVVHADGEAEVKRLRAAEILAVTQC